MQQQNKNDFNGGWHNRNQPSLICCGYAMILKTMYLWEDYSNIVSSWQQDFIMTGIGAPNGIVNRILELERNSIWFSKYYTKLHSDKIIRTGFTINLT